MIKHLIKTNDIAITNIPKTRPLIMADKYGCVIRRPYVEFVELGGIKWRKCNLGAMSITDYGDYYAWGETETKYEDGYSWDNYKFGTSESLTKYNSTDGKTVLEPIDDVATQILGKKWRIPTYDEFEILRQLPNKQTAINGINGCVFVNQSSDLNNEFNEDIMLFIPNNGFYYGQSLSNVGSRGYYWSSSLYQSDPRSGRNLNFDSDNIFLNNSHRFRGYSVRPVLYA